MQEDLKRLEQIKEEEREKMRAKMVQEDLQYQKMK